MPASFFKKTKKTTCSNCGKALEPTRVERQSYCKYCHAEYMRENRTRHSMLPDEARKKANARSYTNVYLKRGKIIKTDCVICGDENSQAHHPDYDKPREVIWLCRSCHLKVHSGKIQVNNSMISPVLN